MKVAREMLTLTSEDRMEFLDITKQIRDAVQKHPISDGIVLVNSLHTTFGVFLAQRANGAPLTVVGDGTQVRDFVFVSDVVEAFMIAAASDLRGEVFNVGSGLPQSVNRLAQLIGGPVIHILKRPGEPDATNADIGKISSPRLVAQGGLRGGGGDHARAARGLEAGPTLDAGAHRGGHPRLVQVPRKVNGDAQPRPCL